MRSGSTTGRTFADEARRRQIVACAIELIAEVGYPTASLAKIAERSGIAKSAVLYHFRGKDELVSAIVETVFEASATTMIPRIVAQTSATDRLRAYIESNGEFLDVHRQEAVALYEISVSYRDKRGLRFDQAVQASVDDAGVPPELALLDPLSILGDGIRDGEFDATAAPAVVKSIVRSSLDGVVRELARDSDYDVLGHTSALASIIISAIGR
ncbi:TetR/AcrR family transcriptional regulator [Gordonia McavH-238-E]|uniref:TetR/AcrR family transcriptional regulator n=1 Tax=Gordonia sp. McavH-238-E TaxID=2917736 RepID=UPI001EF51D74|nr:TetR/AcrR family transcriptional regulator [Gordonia sp. McavH-238-E]MCG7633237.1 TetR/AcrR family transcriptional regulator [Gordonia sp. McavH-238-E]